MKRKLTARENAAKLCSLGKQTRKTLKQKLALRGYEEEEIENAAKAMEEGGYIDEKEYARAFVSDSYRIKKHGRIRIYQELIKRGIASIEAEKAIESFGADECEIIKEEIERRFNKEGKVKIYRHFMARGFSYEDIRRCIDD